MTATHVPIPVCVGCIIIVKGYRIMMNLHNLGLFARWGGPFDRVFFVLAIVGDTLVPDEITKILNLDPTTSYRKDEQTPRGSQYRKTGAWILDSEEVKPEEEEFEDERFLEWIRRLPASPQIWNELNSRFDVRIRLVGYTDQWNADFKITAAIMSELSARGIDLYVEPFLSLDESDEDA